VSGPVTITAGGTYSGTYESLDPNTPAVTIATSQPVVLDGAVIRHTGNGVFARSTRANLTVRNSRFVALAPTGGIVEQLDVYAYQPTAFVVEHNSFTNGHGVLAGGNNLLTSPFSVSFNDFVNIGRYNANSLIGAIHTDQVLAPGGTIRWNRVTNTYGQSLAEDSFGIYKTNGAAGNPIDISHNLVDGDYPYSGNGSGFTGCAFDLGDAGGSWLDGHDNTAVNFTNVGYGVQSGHDIQQRNSVAVYDGHAGFSDSGPVVSSTFGDGATTWQNPSYTTSWNVTISGNLAGHLRYNGGRWERADYYLPVGDSGANTSLGTVNGAAEQAAVDSFEASVVAASVHIGPLT
jgi:hypothetical protein